MKHSRATLSLLTLIVSAPSAHAETPLVASANHAAVSSPSRTTEAIAISFDPPAIREHKAATAPSPTISDSASSTLTPPLTPPAPDIFTGGSNSLVARAVGAAEGTRTPAGHKTAAYYGHTDPGNGVWNLGSFSYQHEAAHPNEADEKQLARLAKQDEILRQRAASLDILEYEVDLTWRLNGIDLANQSPLAALADDGGGYIDRLKQAQEMGLLASEAVLWARVRSFLDPDTGQWNAPGLGNTVDRISQDQERRMAAIATALAHPTQIAQSSSVQPVAQSQADPKDGTEQLIAQNLSSPSQSLTQVRSPTEARAEQIIAQAGLQTARH